jgi:hypothetical protein
MTALNVYEVHHDGVYLNGVSIVVAESEERALSLVKFELTERKLSTRDIRLAQKYDLTNQKCHVVWNGDY